VQDSTTILPYLNGMNIPACSIENEDIPDAEVREWYKSRIIPTGLNNPDLWTPPDLDTAFLFVGGPNKSKHLIEAERVADTLSAHISHKSTVLELGCGFGRIIKFLVGKLESQKKVVSIYGVDFNAGMLELAKNYANFNNVVYLQDTSSLLNHSVDFIYTHAVMIHNDKDQVSVLFNLFSMLIKPDGFMIHDFLSADHADGVKQSDEALRVNFPIYPYAETEIKELCIKHGFAYHKWNNTNSRVIYDFKKLL
jgi:SAM-dependent methyltransferase